MSTTDVIAAGTASPPDLGGGVPVQAGEGPGTWVAQTPIPSGTSYQVRVYTPDPDPAQLAASGDGYGAGYQYSGRDAYGFLVWPGKADGQ